MDDYPRASHPTSEERHLDLRCWMACFADTLGRLLPLANLTGGERFQEWAKVLKDEAGLNKLHWTEVRQQFADFGFHTDKVSLVRPQPPPLKPGQSPPQHKPVSCTRKSVKLLFLKLSFYFVLHRTRCGRCAKRLGCSMCRPSATSPSSLSSCAFSPPTRLASGSSWVILPTRSCCGRLTDCARWRAPRRSTRSGTRSTTRRTGAARSGST